MNTPAGWYPDPEQAGQQRYWDGQQWTDDQAPGSQPPPVKKSGIPTWVKALIGIVGVLVLMVACGALLSGGGDETPSTVATQTTGQDPTGSPDGQAGEEPESQTEAPSLTVSQENAIESAEGYLGMGGFSRSGLIEQLEYEGYSTKDAAFAVDHVEVSWNEQAAKAAAGYMESSSFSRSGLIEQLKYEGFTSKQAAYGVDSVGL